MSKSPEFQIFQKFRKHFSTIETNCEKFDFCVTPPNLTEKKDQTIELCHNYLVAIVDTRLEYNLQFLKSSTLTETRERLRCQLTNRKWQLIVPLAS